MKRPAKTVEITDAMTWWLTKRRVFVVGNYEISLLAINNEDQCVKILVRNLSTNETQEQTIEDDILPVAGFSAFGTK